MIESMVCAPVSVIIPCYQCRDTVVRALDSVLAQSLPPAEILLIDDASDDGTLQVIREQAEQHSSWVKVISQAHNGGAGLARNVGWEAATQPWLAFLDSDDAWHPRKLEIQWTWLSMQPEAGLCGHGTWVAADDYIEPPLGGTPAATRLTLSNMLISNRLPTRSVMLRRDLPFRFSNRRYAEDYQLWLKIIAAGNSAWRLEVPLACSFRPDFSPGGLSGQLWSHEKNELAMLCELWRTKRFGAGIFMFAAGWSFVKFLRRCWLMRKAP